MIQERDESGKKSELQHSVATGVWQGSTLSRATLCLTLWSKMKEVLCRVNSGKLVMGFVSYADDRAVSADSDDANDLGEEVKH